MRVDDWISAERIRQHLQNFYGIYVYMMCFMHHFRIIYLILVLFCVDVERFCWNFVRFAWDFLAQWVPLVAAILVAVRPLILMMSEGSGCSPNGTVVSFRDPFTVGFSAFLHLNATGHLAVSVGFFSLSKPVSRFCLDIVRLPGWPCPCVARFDNDLIASGP